MTTESKIAAALKRLSNEHGLPNKFSAGEVAREAGLSPLEVGKAMRTRGVDHACEAVGIIVYGYGRDTDGVSYVGISARS